MHHGIAALLLLLSWIRGRAEGVAVIEVRLSGSRPYVLSGEPATLVCQWVLEASEEVTEVAWEKDGALVHLWALGEAPGEARGVLEGRAEAPSPSTLAIARASPEMQGTYTCRVRTNGKTAHNEVFLMVIVDACDDSSWSTRSDRVECTEDVSMHCLGVFPKPSPACGVYSERTGKYLSSVPFDSVSVLRNGTFEVSLHRRFSARDWLGQRGGLSFRCYMIVLGTPWRSGITHAMFGDPGCERPPRQLEHGHYNVSGATSCWGHPEEGATAHYRCEEGRRLRGPDTFSCSGGRWVPEDGNGDDIFCSDNGDASRANTPPLLLIASLLLLYGGPSLTTRTIRK